MGHRTEGMVKFKIDVTIGVPREDLEALCAFMETDRGGLKAALSCEALDYLVDYLERNVTTPAIVREGWL